MQTEEIVNGDNLFNEVAMFTTFISPLSSLSSGNNMFNGCNLNEVSVENILNTIPTYTSGEHVLTMTISSKSVDKFREITGCGEIVTDSISVSYKGWTIFVTVATIVAT